MSSRTIHTRIHLRPDGSTRAALLVACPADDQWKSVETCRSCPKVASFDVRSGRAVVTCTERPAGDGDPDKTAITEALEPSSVTVSSDASIDDLVRTMASRGAAVAIVVDDAAHAVGVCSRADLARAPSDALVWSVMTPFVITLLSSASMSAAVDLLMTFDLHYVPVLGGGRILGVVSAASALRWLTQNLQIARNLSAAISSDT